MLPKYWMNPFAGVVPQLKHFILQIESKPNYKEWNGWLKQMSQLESLALKIQWNEDMSCRDLQFGELTNLRQLLISSTANYLNDFAIPSLPNLTRLEVRCRKRTDKVTWPTTWLPNLAGMTALESLALEYLVGEDVVILGRHLPTQLSFLQFEDTYPSAESTGRFLAAIQSHTQLTRLCSTSADPMLFPTLQTKWLEWYSSSAVTELVCETSEELQEEVLWPTCPPMKHLRALTWTNGGWSDMLRQHTQLTRLTIISTGCPLESVPVLQGLTLLQHLHIFAPTPTALFQICCPELTHLTVRIDDDVLPDFYAFLNNHPLLSHLTLSSAVKTMENCTTLWNQLIQCPQLDYLVVVDEYLIPNPVDIKLDWKHSSLRFIAHLAQERAGRIYSIILPDNHTLIGYANHLDYQTEFKENKAKNRTLLELVNGNWGLEYVQSWWKDTTSEI